MRFLRCRRSQYSCRSQPHLLAYCSDRYICSVVVCRVLVDRLALAAVWRWSTDGGFRLPALPCTRSLAAGMASARALRWRYRRLRSVFKSMLRIVTMDWALVLSNP